MPTDPHHTPTNIQPSTSQPQKKQRSRRSKRKDTEVPQPSGPTTNVVDEAVNKEMDDSLERVATTATGLEAERQETMRGTIAQTRSENVSKLSNDLLLARGNTLRSCEDRLKLEELIALCTTLQSRVLALETTKTTQATKITKSSEDEGLGKEDASKQGRIADIDANEDIYLVNVQTDKDMFGVNDLDGDEVIVKSVDDVNTAEETRSVVEEVSDVTVPVSAATTTTAITDVEMNLAQALAELKSEKPKDDKVVIQKPEQDITTPILTTTTATITIIVVSTRPRAKGIVFHDQEQAPTPTFSSQQPSQVKVRDKAKGKMVKPEPVKKMSKKELLRLDEELAFKLQAEEEEERLAREKAQQVEEANIAWDDVQAKIDADYQLAQRLQAQDQDELTDEEKARLFVQLLEQRRKHFATKRAKEKRNIPPTRAQQRSIITELVEESSKKAEAEIAHESILKRAGEELEQESFKKQKLEEDKESEELKKCLEIISDDGDDVTIDVTPLSTKSPTIVDYKIYKEGNKSYFQIIRANVKARFKKTKPVNYMDNFLLLNLKTMFEHHVEDNKMIFYLLVEKMYPLTNHTLHQMFNDVKLQVDYECEMAFELLRLVKKQLKEGYRIVGIQRLHDDLEVTAAKIGGEGIEGDGVLNWMSIGVIGERPLVDGDVEEVGDLSLESMEDEEVATVDGVFEGAFGALGLEVEALMDTVEVYSG
ncbi:hypothetical protein Tco_0697507 [Tanacetum coccineum]